MAETVIRKHLFGFYCDVLDRLIAYQIVLGFEELFRIHMFLFQLGKMSHSQSRRVKAPFENHFFFTLSGSSPGTSTRDQLLGSP